MTASREPELLSSCQVGCGAYCLAIGFAVLAIVWQGLTPWRWCLTRFLDQHSWLLVVTVANFTGLSYVAGLVYERGWESIRCTRPPRPSGPGCGCFASACAALYLFSLVSWPPTYPLRLTAQPGSVTVRLKGGDGRSVRPVTRKQTAGSSRFRYDLPSGEYTVTASRKGYHDERLLVRVPDRRALSLTLEWDEEFHRRQEAAQAEYLRKNKPLEVLEHRWVDLTAVGTIRNNNDQTYRSVKLCLKVYDDKRRVLTVLTGQTRYLEPGQLWNYQIRVPERWRARARSKGSPEVWGEPLPLTSGE